jgi:hypothetical protein
MYFWHICSFQRIIKAKQVLLMKENFEKMKLYSVSYRVQKYKNTCNCKKNNTYSTTYWLRTHIYNRVSTKPRNSNPCKSRTYCKVNHALTRVCWTQIPLYAWPNAVVELTLQLHIRQVTTRAYIWSKSHLKRYSGISVKRKLFIYVRLKGSYGGEYEDDSLLGYSAV